MKFALIIPDGCADEPQEVLGGRTPLQAARTPAMDEIARTGIVGRSCNVPAHLPAGSDVATISLMGYDVSRCFTGRAPLEAAAQNITLRPHDWAIRCNLVTLDGQFMRDFTAGHISSEEARELLMALQQHVRDSRFQFVPGVSYRNLLIYHGGDACAPFGTTTTATPPHDLTDKCILQDYPRGPGCDLMVDLMTASWDVFTDHPVNQRRVAAGKRPATNVWLWGVGSTPQLEPFAQRFGIRGTMITAVDLLKGLANLVGWSNIDVPGATGYTDTDYAAKGRFAVDALPTTDLICVHVEAPDEASHEGNAEAKVHALEEIDRHIVQPLHAALVPQGAYRILVSPDHPTFLRTKTHSHGDVPWAMCGEGISPDASVSYDEGTAVQSANAFAAGHDLMPFFLNCTSRK